MKNLTAEERALRARDWASLGTGNEEQNLALAADHFGVTAEAIRQADADFDARTEMIDNYSDENCRGGEEA